MDDKEKKAYKKGFIQGLLTMWIAYLITHFGPMILSYLFSGWLNR